jgi:transposase
VIGPEKDQPLGISSLFVCKDDQIAGLTHLLTLGVRVMTMDDDGTMMEWQVRRSLQAAGVRMAGLYPGNPKQPTDRPTTVGMLAAVARMMITLTVVTWHGQTSAMLSPLPPLLREILRHLHLPLSLYTDLVT